MSAAPGDAPAPTDTTSSLRLAPGEIPRTWTRPAEAVSTLPQPAPRPVTTGVLVGVGIVACAALAVALAPARPSAPAPAPAPAAAAPVAHPVSEIPRPPATSSTDPGDVAPEDQGGDAPAPPAPPVAAPPAPATAATDEARAPLVAELPAHKKSAGLTARAIARLRDGDYANAEPLLVRAVLIDPTYPDAWRHLGIARAQLGDKSGARRAYKKYVELAPTAPDAAQVRAILAAP